MCLLTLFFESKTSRVPTISLWRCISWNAGSEEKFPKKRQNILLQIDSVELRFLSAMPPFLLDIQAALRHQGSLGLHIHIWYYLNPCRFIQGTSIQKTIGKKLKNCVPETQMCHFTDTSRDEGGWSQAFEIFLSTYLGYRVKPVLNTALNGAHLK